MGIVSFRLNDYRIDFIATQIYPYKGSLLSIGEITEVESA